MYRCRSGKASPLAKMMLEIRFRDNSSQCSLLLLDRKNSPFLSCVPRYWNWSWKSLIPNWLPGRLIVCGFMHFYLCVCGFSFVRLHLYVFMCAFARFNVCLFVRFYFLIVRWCVLMCAYDLNIFPIQTPISKSWTLELRELERTFTPKRQTGRMTACPLVHLHCSREPFHVFASLQLTTSATRNCVWTSKAVQALKMRPYKTLLQLMWNGQSWTSVRPKLRPKVSTSSAKSVLTYPSSKIYLECRIQFSRGVHITKSNVVLGTLTQTNGCLSRTLRPSLPRWQIMVSILYQTSSSQTQLVLHNAQYSGVWKFIVRSPQAVSKFPFQSIRNVDILSLSSCNLEGEFRLLPHILFFHLKEGI